MRFTLRLPIVAGKTTCAARAGDFCRFVGTTRMGSTYVCMLFPPNQTDECRNGAVTVLKENDKGWLMRCPACIEATEKPTRTSQTEEAKPEGSTY